MRVASAILVKGAGEGVKDKEGKPVIRPYTPVTSPETPGHLDLLIKKYPNGAMTSHVHGLKPGDKLAFKGPIDKFEVSVCCNHEGEIKTDPWLWSPLLFLSLLFARSTSQTHLSRLLALLVDLVSHQCGR